MINYKGHVIERHLSGWYSVLIPGTGSLKADTLGRIKKLINQHLNPVSNLPVMKACCKTCPFKQVNGKNQNETLVATIIERNLFKAQQICHGTEGKNRKPNNRCKGYYDYAFTLYRRLGLEPEKYLK